MPNNPAPRSLSALADEIALEHLCWARDRDYSYFAIGRAIGRTIHTRQQAIDALAKAWRLLFGHPRS